MVPCVLRHGHNEQDDPTLTLPLTYKTLETHPTVLELYQSQLQSQGLVDSVEISKQRSQLMQHYDEEYKAALAGQYSQTAEGFLAASWQGAALQVSFLACEGEDDKLI